MKEASITGIMAVQFDPSGFVVSWNGTVLAQQPSAPILRHLTSPEIFDMSLPMGLSLRRYATR